MLKLGAELSRYHLPKNVLPLAPSRDIFSSVDEDVLQTAAELALQFPQKRGPLSHAARKLSGTDAVPISFGQPSVTIEAHFDSVAIPTKIANALPIFGFEIDGFYKFNPSHYGDHYTLKFKVPYADQTTRNHLLRFTKDSCRALIEYLQEHEPALECYLELETYSSSNRIHLNGCTYRRWLEPPIEPTTFRSVEVPTSDKEAAASKTDSAIVKRADIHAKLSPQISDEDREHIVAMMHSVGFYDVVTWAGNTVCTGQFAEIAQAKKTFRRMVRFLKKFGGVTEITLEPCPFFWRSQISPSGSKRWAAVPPILLAQTPGSAAK
jgi:hypothetical protein